MIGASLTKVWSRLSNGIKRLVSKPSDDPQPRRIYAVSTGRYRGEFFVYMDSVPDMYIFLSLPDLHVRYIPADEFKSGVDAGVLDMVETLPSDVYNVCISQYTKIKETGGTGDSIPSKPSSDT